LEEISELGSSKRIPEYAGRGGKKLVGRVGFLNQIDDTNSSRRLEQGAIVDRPEADT